MTHQIFKKAAAALDIVKKEGQWGEITTHPTQYGNSAYITSGRVSKNGCVGLKRHIRLSDHGVGDFRNFADKHRTIIDDDKITIAYLAEKLTISDDDLAISEAKYIAEKKEKAAKDEQFWAEALDFWASLSPDDKHMYAPKQHAGKDKKARAVYALRNFKRWSK